MSYNLSFMDNSTNILHLAQGVNTASDGWYAVLFLFVLWIGLYATFKKEDTVTELVISSFVTAVVAILFFLIGLLTWQIALIPIVAFFLSSIYYFIAG